MAINWELGRTPDIIGNALAAFDQGQQRRQQMDHQNALLALRQQEAQQRQAEQQAKQQDQRRADLPMIGRLLDHARDENTYQEARAAAAQYGIDVSQLPANFGDGAWVQQQRGIVAALQDPAKMEALSTAGKIAADMGYKPGTPEFNAKVSEVWATDATKYIPVTPGGSIAAAVPGREPRYIIGGGQSGDMPRVSTPDDYSRLSPGSHYMDPSGNIRQKAGGQTGSAPSGDFQSAFSGF